MLIVNAEVRSKWTQKARGVRYSVQCIFRKPIPAYFSETLAALAVPGDFLQGLELVISLEN